MLALVFSQRKIAWKTLFELKGKNSRKSKLFLNFNQKPKKICQRIVDKQK